MSETLQDEAGRAQRGAHGEGPPGASRADAPRESGAGAQRESGAGRGGAGARDEAGAALLDVADYLGPAVVTERPGGAIAVELPGGQAVLATPAFSVPYQAAVGDVLLVITRGPRAYAIGVLEGTGRAAITFAGDVDLHALDGRVRLSADRGIELRSTEVDLVADKLRVLAGEAVHTMTSLCQRVTGLFRLHAGQSQTLVEEGCYTQAKNAAIVTEETVTLNGREIHLA